MNMILYLLLKAIWFPFSLLPLRLLRPLSDFVSAAVFFCLPARRKISLMNLDIAFGDALSRRKKSEIARRSFQNAARCLLELLTVDRILPAAGKHFTITGDETLIRTLKEGRSVICPIAHLGSWELHCMYPFLRDIPFSVVVKTQRNPYLDRDLKRLREKMKVKLINKDASAARQVLGALKKGSAVAVVTDQWAGGEGRWVPFFGKETSTTSLPVRLAIKTGAALIPSVCIRQAEGRYEIRMLHEIVLDPSAKDPEQKGIEAINGVMETLIRKYPEQWLWAHRRWKPRPAGLS